MKCKQIQTQLADYSAQRLAPSDAERIRLHLDSCNACSLFLREESALAGQLERLSMVEPSKDLWAAVSAGLDAPQAETRRWRLALPIGLRPAAALATSAALAVGLFTYSQQRPTAPPAEIAKTPNSRKIVAPSPANSGFAALPSENIAVDDPMAEQFDSLVAAVEKVSTDGGNP